MDAARGNLRRVCAIIVLWAVVNEGDGYGCQHSNTHAEARGDKLSELVYPKEFSLIF
jgi:hypothetical protein